MIFFTHFKYTKLLKQVIKDENLLQNLSELYGAEFKMDWVGRIYAVLNPYLKDGQYDPSAAAFEYGENGRNDNSFVENWIMEKMFAASQFIKTNNLFDMLTYNIKKLDDSGNYLFVMKSISFDEFVKTCKVFSILGCSLILGLILIQNLF